MCGIAGFVSLAPAAGADANFQIWGDVFLTGKRIRAFPKLLGPGNRMWLHFVSYKLGRLAMPYALVALAASSLYLPGIWMPLAVAPQAIFYGLAAADRWVPQTFLLKPVSSPARTFVVMMAAAVCALSVFFVSPQSLWKETKIAPARQAGGC
jgi:hypothetical protein